MQEKKLVRSQNKMLAGVAAGLADYLGMDPVLIRLAFVVLAFMGSGGVWIYLVLWIIMPEASADPSAPPPAAPPPAA